MQKFFNIHNFTKCAFMLFMLQCTHAFALGNYPEAAACPPDKPYTVICTHPLHNLEGWRGSCHASSDAAQKESDEHTNNQHQGNSRWTGILKVKFNAINE